MKEFFVFAALIAVAKCTNITLRIGDPATLNFGDENTTYCVLRDNTNNVVVENFGSCQYRIDSVMEEHAGKWEAIVATNFEGIPKPVEYTIDTVPRPIIHTTYYRIEEHVHLSCYLNTSQNFLRTKFRGPQNEILVLGKSDEENSVYTYTYQQRSFELDGYDSIIVTLIINEDEAIVAGIWRCGIEVEGPSENNQFYGFVNVPSLNQYSIPDDQSPKLRSYTSHVNASSGHSFTLMCNYDNNLNYCYFRSLLKGRIYAVAPGVSNNEYEYVGAGLEAGECGIRIFNARPAQSGSWSCNINTKNEYNTEVSQYIDVLVTGVNVNFEIGPNRRFTIMASNIEPTVTYLRSCRFVRSDGLSILSGQFIDGYSVIINQNMCTLVTENYCNLDFNNWLVGLRVPGERTERFTVATPEIESEPVPPQQPRPPSSGGSSFFWVWRTFFGFLILGFMLVLISLMITDYRRKWASRKSIAVRSNLNNNISHISPIPPAQTHVVVDPRLVEEKPALS